MTMISKRRITVKILRANPTGGSEPRYEQFETEVEPGTSVTGLLRQLNREHDGSLAYRVSCRQGVCGTCTMKVNGRPGLACCIEVTGDLVLEPAFPWNVLKDLVSQSGKRAVPES